VARRVLIVCAGNICRSPAAAAMLRALAPEIEVRSRGVHDWNVGRRAHPSMTRLAGQRGYQLSEHVAAQAAADDLVWADDVLVMDAENQAQLTRRFPPGLVRGVRLLDPDGIPDPWLVDTDAAYSDSLDRIERAVRAYIDSLNASTTNEAGRGDVPDRS
jgi:protein-tyrosine phosphatase